MPKTLRKIYLRIAPSRFHYLKFILEGYDNLAILSSFDKTNGIVVLSYPQEMTEDLFGLLASIAGHLVNQNRILLEDYK